MARYRMTARRKAALRKAQLASARKRRRRAVRTAGVIGVTLGGLYLQQRHRQSSSTFMFSSLTRPELNPHSVAAGNATKKPKIKFERSQAKIGFNKRFALYADIRLGSKKYSGVYLHVPINTSTLVKRSKRSAIESYQSAILSAKALKRSI